MKSLALLPFLVVAVVHCAVSEHEITSVPGFSGVLPSKHYGGYMEIDATRGKNLYYYFVESTASTKDPVVLWLNGGPGCSSFDGWFYEHGPFVWNSDGTVATENKNTWAAVSNMIFLDSPVGVGYSFSRSEEDYHTNDTQTASDTEAFLRLFFTHYPEFADNDFYIAGESYAGIYVPNAARAVLHGNQKHSTPTINLRGYLVGNGCTDEVFDGNALVPFAYGMSFVPIDLHEQIEEECQGSYWNATGKCSSLLDQMDNMLHDLNIYDVLEACVRSPSSPRPRHVGRAWPLRAQVKEGRVPSWSELVGSNGEVPCVDSHAANHFLNLPETRSALHAESVDDIGKWTICSNKIRYSHDAGSMIPVHRELMDHNIRSLIFSGDHDMCVPYTGSEAWTRSMKLPVVEAWRSWKVDDQVAGFSVHYDKLTFATVKGAGHTVPEYKPVEALAMYRRFLAGEAL